MSNIALAYNVAHSAGFRGDSLITALAIAGAESNWNNDAIGDKNIVSEKYGPSVGFWQIRSLKPDYLHLDKWRDQEKLKDATFNAQATYSISNKGTDWQPWAAYTNGSYTKYLDEAKNIVDQKSKSTKLNASIFWILLLIGLILIIIYV